LAVADSPDYPQIIERLKTGNENFLDLGCCFGQEIRRLVADGAPSENTYGCDLRQDFFEQGYAFFKDRDTLKSKFIVADIFDPNSGLKEIDGNIDIIYAGSFIHLFGYEQQVEVCVRIAKLLREKPGSLLVGRQIGHLNAGVMPHRMDKEHKMFRHNPDSFQKLWDEVGEKTGTKWRVEGKMTEVDFGEDQKGWRNDEGLRRLSFSVFRL
jgi:SAM-dependent methyltransferase